MRRLGLVLVAVLAAVLLLELGLSALGWRTRAVPAPFEGLAHERLAGVEEFVYHPERFYTLAPRRRASPEHLGRYASGSWPFRGRPPRPAPDLVRLAVVGDSSMYGFGVETALCVPSLLQDELDRRGLGPERVLVTNFGVSGYTTVQVDLCLAQVLREEAPDAVVIGCGGWNDQGPSLGIDDVAMLVRPPPPWWCSWLPATCRWQAARVLEPLVLPPVDSAALNAAWERGEPLFGTKVPAEYVPVAVGRALERCRAAGVPVVVVVPAHPAETLARYPRTRADGDAVRRAAREAGVPFVDAPALFAATGLSDERLHLDFGHPTPEGNALVAAALAEELEPLVAAALRPAPARPPTLEDWSPRRASMLGDQRFALRVRGLPEGELPVVLLGNAPLIGLEREGELLRGLAMANGEGPQTLVVQSSAGCAVAREAVLLERPWLEPLSARPPRVRLHARPGDAVQLYWSDQRRAEPAWWQAGPVWLAGTPGTPVEPQQRCDEQGQLELALPPQAAALPRLWLQARVGPRDAGPWEAVSVASAPLELVLPDDR